MQKKQATRGTSMSEDSLIIVLEFLVPSDLMASAVVSQQWFRLASDDRLWELIYLAEFGYPASNVVAIPAGDQFIPCDISSEQGHLVGTFRRRYIGRALLPVFNMPPTRAVDAFKNSNHRFAVDGFGESVIRPNQCWSDAPEKQTYAQFTDSNPSTIIATTITICMDLYTHSHGLILEDDGWLLYSSAIVSTTPTSAWCEMEFEGKEGGVAGCQLWDDMHAPNDTHAPNDMKELLRLRVTMQQPCGKMVTILELTGDDWRWTGDCSEGLEADGTFLAAIQFDLNIPLAPSPIEGSCDGFHLGFLSAEIILRLTPDENALASHTANSGDPSWEDLLEQQCMAVPQTILFKPFWLGLGHEAYDKAMAFDFYSRLPWT
jgi:hypothetical protein